MTIKTNKHASAASATVAIVNLHPLAVRLRSLAHGLFHLRVVPGSSNSAAGGSGLVVDLPPGVQRRREFVPLVFERGQVG